ncbi:MAG: ABC transporter ATP-binding protein [Gammaproteobacteria bacterium]|nr:ABC transporter ATP-binding protein [Gammaproteobacteria bacterium]
MIGTEQAYSPYPPLRRAVAITSPVAGNELKSLFTDALPHRWPLAVASILMLAKSATALTVPWLAGELTLTLLDSGSGTFASSQAIFLLMVLVFAVQALMSIGDGYLLSRTGEHIVSALRVRVYDHLQSLPLEYHQDRRKGDVLSLLTRDVDVLSGYITGTLIAIVPLLLTFLGAWILMLRIDWFLACLAGLLVPVFFVLMRLLGRHIRPLSREVSEAHASSVAIAEENLGLLPIIKAFTRERAATRQYRDQSRRVLALSNRLHLSLSTLRPIMGFLSASGIVGLLWLASTELPPAELVSFFMYGLLLARPMSGLAATWGETQHARAAMERLKELFRVQPEPLSASAHALPPARGSIVFERVSFRYGGREPLFQDFDLEVSAGETVAITGENGAGKSSLVNLLLRFFDPQTGRVLIDGTDISTVSLSSLRSQIGLVPQYILLFNGSIRENIAFGHNDPDPQKLQAAAEAARAHEFICSLPDGYDTLIGERGIKLSGGQQQRIALARALLKDPPILILDEATSMFDPTGEEEFLALTEDTFRDRTVLLITHRAASLALADRVLRMEDGRVVPAGVRDVPREGRGS